MLSVTLASWKLRHFLCSSLRLSQLWGFRIIAQAEIERVKLGQLDLFLWSWRRFFRTEEAWTDGETRYYNNMMRRHISFHWLCRWIVAVPVQTLRLMVDKLGLWLLNTVLFIGGEGAGFSAWVHHLQTTIHGYQLNQTSSSGCTVDTHNELGTKKKTPL